MLILISAFLSSIGMPPYKHFDKSLLRYTNPSSPKTNIYCYAGTITNRTAERLVIVIVHD